MPRWNCRGLLTILTAALALTVTSTRRASAATLTLEDALARALAVAPAVSSAAAQSDFDRARVDEARAPLFPSIAGTGDYQQSPGYQEVITNRGQTLAQLGLDYVAYDGGRRAAQVRSAGYAAEASALGLATARNQIIFDTTVAYFDLLRARDAEIELQANAARLAQYVKVVGALRRSGRAIDNDVLILRSAYDSADLSLAAAHQIAAHTSIVLGSMIGDFSDTTLQVTDVAAPTPPPSGDGSANPAYRAAARQVQAAKLAVEAARAERSPTFKVALTTGWLGVDPPRTFDHFFGASYDTTISVPIFDGGLIRSHINEAQATERVAQAQQRQIEVQNRRDLADAKARYDGAADQIAILRRSQQTADDAFALAWTRFLGGGSVTLLEVTSSYQQAESLRLTLFDQEFAARQATAQAQMILGLTQ
jgi:outer membrane protein TolC